MDLKSILEFPEKLQPGLSIDCVIFGFHENTLKVLLIKPVFLEKWTLPGGFIAINESIDDAAANVLKDRTGLNGIFLKQFATFGDLTRSNSSFNKSVLSFYKIPEKLPVGSCKGLFLLDILLWLIFMKRNPKPI